MIRLKVAFISKDASRFNAFKSYLANAYAPYDALFFSYEQILSAQQNILENISLMIVELHPDESMNKLFIRQYFRNSNTFKVCLSNQVNYFTQILYLRLGFDTCVELSDDAMHIDELIKAQLRFLSHMKHDSKEMHEKTVGPFTFNFNQLSCYQADGKSIKLTKKEFKMMYLLLEYPTHVLSYDRLISAVWDDNKGNINALNLLIRRLRLKLKCDEVNQSLIINVHGIGYKLNHEYCK
jgi:DNA-binding response OmpR family regulator